MNQRFIFVLGILLSGTVRAQSFQDLPAKDQSYLKGLLRDTWHSVASLECGSSGLPFDNSDRGDYTSVSNIGIYLSCVCAAKHLGLVGPREEEDRLRRTITSVEKLKTHFGFQQSWQSVRDLSPSTSDTWVSLLDSGNLAAGLLTVAGESKALHDRARRLFKAMEWEAFYDPDQKVLLGGYDVRAARFNPQWHLDLLASDALLCQYFYSSTGRRSPDFWGTLKTPTETWEGISYIGPGMHGGGLFMQFLPSIWLDTKGTVLWKSSLQFSKAQMAHMQSIGSPVWGWSACDNPAGGYLGWGSLKDSVVTPHSSALAVAMFPNEVISNLAAFERFGTRSAEYGFFDAYDWRTEARSEKFLVLDQGMLFLSLANFVHPNVVQRLFDAGGDLGEASKAFKQALKA